MSRIENMINAMKHNELMNEKFKKEIKNSVRNTKYFSGFDGIEFVESRGYDTDIQILDTSAENAICVFHDEDTTVLNFASFLSPGGGYMKGCDAQEECLCHASTLYQVLSQFTKSFYLNNKKDSNNGLFYDVGLFSPNIIFHDEYSVNVITVASPNMNEYKKYCYTENIPQIIITERNQEILERRIDFLLGILNKMKQKTIILGAFGCGVFMQSPMIVSSIFHKLLETKYKRCFKRVIFAIPRNNVNMNYDAFVYVFNKSKKGLYKMDKKLNKYNIEWFNIIEAKNQIIHIKATSKEEAKSAAILIMKSVAGPSYNEFDIINIEEVVDEEYLTIEDIMNRYCKFNK